MVIRSRATSLLNGAHHVRPSIWAAAGSHRQASRSVAQLRCGWRPDGPRNQHPQLLQLSMELLSEIPGRPVFRSSRQFRCHRSGRQCRPRDRPPLAAGDGHYGGWHHQRPAGTRTSAPTGVRTIDSSVVRYGAGGSDLIRAVQRRALGCGTDGLLGRPPFAPSSALRSGSGRELRPRHRTPCSRALNQDDSKEV